MKRLTLEGGARVGIFAPPPSGFDPLTASAADLAKHGFPVPEQPQHRERFERIFRQMKNRFQYIVPEFHLVRKRERAQGLLKSKPVIQAGNERNYVWSGAHVYPPAGQAFRWVVGQWMVPNVSAPPNNEEYYTAVWVGIDGGTDATGLLSSDVCQVGVNCDVIRSHSSTSVTIYPWWEWYDPTADTGQMGVSNLTVKAGDTVAVTICTSGPGATHATAFFANITSGVGTAFAMFSEPGVSLIGNCAEWIVEKPQVNGQPSMLADYGEVFFSGCEAVSYTPDGSGVTVVGGGTQNYIDMYPPPGATLISQGILIAPTVVQCVYVG
jgi:Peptidase A4 family